LRRVNRPDEAQPICGARQHNHAATQRRTIRPAVSAIGLGCNNFGQAARSRGLAPSSTRRSIGITFFDCGDVYGRRGGAETILGEVLGVRRKDVILVTKFGRPMDAEGKLKEARGAISRPQSKQACGASRPIDRPLPVSPR
jgi:aryl-alcohol dehydrogenase-like predicted oxidoreductase